MKWGQWITGEGWFPRRLRTGWETWNLQISSDGTFRFNAYLLSCIRERASETQITPRSTHVSPIGHDNFFNARRQEMMIMSRSCDRAEYSTQKAEYFLSNFPSEIGILTRVLAEFSVRQFRRSSTRTLWSLPGRIVVDDSDFRHVVILGCALSAGLTILLIFQAKQCLKNCRYLFWKQKIVKNINLIWMMQRVALIF